MLTLSTTHVSNFLILDKLNTADSFLDHKKTLEKVAAPENIPCPTCESGVTTPQLRTRIAQLDAMLQQHVTEGGFSEWQAEHPEVPTHPWQATQHITSAADLQRHLLELESLLLCGFGLSTSNQTTPRAPGSPASAVAARPSTTPPPSAPKPRFSILRGATGFRREFFPGVQWDATRLSRKETAKRREAWRREHGT